MLVDQDKLIPDPAEDIGRKDLSEHLIIHRNSLPLLRLCLHRRISRQYVSFWRHGCLRCQIRLWLHNRHRLFWGSVQPVFSWYWGRFGYRYRFGNSRRVRLCALAHLLFEFSVSPVFCSKTVRLLKISRVCFDIQYYFPTFGRQPFLPNLHLCTGIPQRRPCILRIRPAHRPILLGGHRGKYRLIRFLAAKQRLLRFFGICKRGQQVGFRTRCTGFRQLAILGQCRFDRKIDRVKHALFADKSHLNFRRMDVDIHLITWQCQHQHTGRIFPDHHRTPVSFLQCNTAGLGPGIPSVDKKVLHCPVGARRHRPADKPADANLPHAVIDRQHGFGEIPSQYGIDGPQQIAIAGGPVDLFAVPNKGNRDIGMRKGDLVHNRSDRIGLGDILFQKFEPRRNVVKYIPDDDGCSFRAPGFGYLLQLGPADLDQRPDLTVVGLGQQFNMGDRCNRRQRFPPESQRSDPVEVNGRLHLTGRMPQKGSRRILSTHPAAIVGDPQIAHAAILNFNRDIAGAGVNRVFNQLLDDRGRTLDHLTRCDQLRHLPRQHIDLWHIFLSFPRLIQSIRQLGHLQPFSSCGIGYSIT